MHARVLLAAKYLVGRGGSAPAQGRPRGCIAVGGLPSDLWDGCGIRGMRAAHTRGSCCVMNPVNTSLAFGLSAGIRQRERAACSLIAPPSPPAHHCEQADAGDSYE
jgi:hypothetical protein